MSRPIERILTEGLTPLVANNSPKEPAYGVGSASVDAFQGLLWNAASAVSDLIGLEGVSDAAYAKSKENYANVSMYPRDSMAHGEVKLGDNFGKWLADTLIIDGLPTISIAAGTIAASVASGGTALLPALFALGASSTYNLGEIYGESRDELGKENVNLSVILAASGINGALDVITPFKVAKKFFPGGASGLKNKALKELSRNGGLNHLSRFLREGAKGFTVEAFTEALQEWNIIVAINIEAGKENVFEVTSDQWKRIENALYAGGALGSTARGATAFVGKGNAKKIITAREVAQEQISSDLNSSIEPIQLEIKDLEAQAKAGGGRKVLARKVSLENKIKDLEEEAGKKREKVNTSYSVADIEKLVPIKEEEAAKEVADIIGAGLEDQTLQQIKDSDKLRQAERATQPETIPLKPVDVASATADAAPDQQPDLANANKDAAPVVVAPNLPFKYDGGEIETTITPEEAEVREEARVEAERIASLTPAGTEGTPIITPQQQVITSGGPATAPVGTERGRSATQEQLDAIPPLERPYPGEVPGLPVAPKEGAAPQPSPHTPSFEIDSRRGLPVVPKDPNRSRVPYSTLREERRIARETEAKRQAERKTQPIFTPVVESDIVTFGEILITAPDIEAAKNTKQRKDIEDTANQAYNEAYTEAQLNYGYGHEEASNSGEEAYQRVVQEGGDKRRRIYSSPEARAKAEKEAAADRQKRKDTITAQATMELEAQEKFEKDETIRLKTLAEEKAEDFMDWLNTKDPDPTIEEIEARRKSDIESLRGSIEGDPKLGGVAAANTYRKIASRERLNKILENRNVNFATTPEQKGQLDPDKKAKEKTKAAPKTTTEEAPPKGGVGSSGAPTPAGVSPDGSKLDPATAKISEPNPLTIEENKRIKELGKKREELDDALETDSPELRELVEGKNLEHEKLLLEEMELRINQLERGILERGFDLERWRTNPDNKNPLPGWIRDRDQAKKNIEALEAGVDPATVPGTTINPVDKAPTQADATPDAAPAATEKKPDAKPTPPVDAEQKAVIIAKAKEGAENQNHRQLTATILTIRNAQKRRKGMLADDDILREKSESTGIPIEELREVTQQNIDNQEVRLETLEEILPSKKKSDTSKIEFTDVEDSDTAQAKADKKLVEDNLEAIREESQESDTTNKEGATDTGKPTLRGTTSDDKKKDQAQTVPATTVAAGTVTGVASVDTIAEQGAASAENANTGGSTPESTAIEGSAATQTPNLSTTTVDKVADVVDEVADVVLTETVPREAPVLKYAESTINPQGVPIRIYDDRLNPEINIVESEGVVLYRRKDRAKAETLANNATAATVERHDFKVKVVPKRTKRYTGPQPADVTDSLFKFLSGDMLFKMTVGPMREKQATNFGIDPTQYTTEEELYDAIIEKIEATPVEPVAPVAADVQEIAEEIVEESNLERLDRLRMERKVTDEMYPEIDEDGDTITVTNEEKVKLIKGEPDSTTELYDDTGWYDSEAANRAAAKQERLENEARSAERSLEKQTPVYLTSLPLDTALKNISNPRKPDGYDINALRALAENILESDPSFTYNKKGKRKELEASIHEWIIRNKNITEVEDNSPYENTVDEVNGTVRTSAKPMAESRVPTVLESLKGERGFNAAEVEASINEELVKIFGSRTVKEMKKLLFINFLSNKEAIKTRGVDNLSTIAFVDQNNGSVYFIPSRISNNTVATSDSIRGLIWHEIGVHVGRDLLSSNEFSSIIGEVRKMYNNGDTYAVDAYEQVVTNYKNLLIDGDPASALDSDSPTNMFWEEVLAHMIQYRGEELNLQRPSLIKRVQDAFKKFFLRIGEAFGMEDAPAISIDDLFNIMAGATIERLPSFINSRLVSLAEKNITTDAAHGYLDNIFKRRLKARNDFINDSVEKNHMYHSSDKNWSAPILEFTELGLHVGTVDAAILVEANRKFRAIIKEFDKKDLLTDDDGLLINKDMESAIGNIWEDIKNNIDPSKLKRGYIKVTNPFVVGDINSFDGPANWANHLNQMMKDGAISEKDYNKLFPIAKAWTKVIAPLSGTKEVLKGFQEFAIEFRDALKSLDYDAIKYVNEAEDKGSISYILLSENQFKSVESLTFNSGINAFKDARAAIASPEKELGLTKKINDIAKPQVKDTRESQGKLFRAAKRIQRAIEPLMTLAGYTTLETQRMLTKGEIGRYHNMGRVLFDVLYQADAKEKKVILDYFETRNASPDALPDRKVDVAMLPTVAKGTRSTASSSEKQSIKDAVVKAKVQIEKLGSDLVAQGLITKEQYGEWQGQYLPRAYLRYLGTDRIARGLGTSKMTYTKVRSAHENFLKDIVDGRIKDPGFLAGRYISMAGADLATINYLNFIAADTGKNGWVLPNQLVKYNGMQGTVGYWNELVGDMRKRISQTELLDPSKVEDMKRVANEIQSAIDKVGEIGSPEGYKRVPDSARYGAMKGLYVKKEIIDDIMGMESLYSNNEFLNSVLSFSTKTSKWFKYTKVPMNIPTQARNIISNTVLMDVSGTSFFKIPGLLSRAMSDIVADGKYAQLARKYGIEMTTFSSEELVTMDRELNKLKAEDKSWSGMWARSKIFFHDYLDVGGRAYAKTEVMFKIAKMIDFMENHGKSEGEAARLANEALLDYGNVSQGIRVIRSLPFGSPFITFNLKAGAQMIRNIRNHPIAVAKYAAIPYLVAQMLLDQNDDIEEEDIPAMKELVADYMSKNLTTMVMPWKDSEGRLRVFDMGYFLPWGAHLNLGKNLWDGEFGEAMRQPGFFGGPFQAIPGLMSNKDPFTGYEIWNEADPPRQRYEDMLGFIASYAFPPMLMPRNKSGDVIGNGGQLVKTLMYADQIDGNIDKDGLPKNTFGTTALSWLGVNTQPLTAKTAQRKIFFKGKEVKSVMNRLRKLIDDPNVTPEKRKQLINEYRAHAMNIMKELQELQTAYGKVSDAL